MINIEKLESKKSDLASSSFVDDELRDLEVDGYKIVFTRKVGLLPVELVDIKPVGDKDNE